MFGLLKKLLGLGANVAEKVLGKRGELEAKNLEINAETERASNGGMTPRKLFMYMICFVFFFEYIVRPTIATYFPEVPLPPSALDETLATFSAMFSLGL